MEEKELAERLVQEAYEAFSNGRKALLALFIETLRAANNAKVSDQRISELINGEYSRARIGQFRAGKVGKRDQ